MMVPQYQPCRVPDIVILAVRRVFFGASALSIARCAALTPAAWFSALPDFVWPTRPARARSGPSNAPHHEAHRALKEDFSRKIK
jgi:hypothetical protein